jgi:hypothetical protein
VEVPKRHQIKYLGFFPTQVRDQEVDGSNPFARPLLSIRYAGFSTTLPCVCSFGAVLVSALDQAMARIIVKTSALAGICRLKSARQCNRIAAILPTQPRVTALSKRSSAFLVLPGGLRENPENRAKQQNCARQTDLAGNLQKIAVGVLNEESGLLTIRNPDVFHLNGVVEEPTAFALIRIEPVDGPAFVCKHLL